MTRQLNDWISSYLEFSKNTESPLAYHTWAAISIVASTLQRRVVMKWGHEDIYANEYVVLVGPSGLSRKGSALGLARPFIEHVQIPIVANRITNEKLFQYVADTITSFNGPHGEAKMQCSATIFSSELHVFLGRANVDLLAALTDWYDCLPRWEYDTKHQGRDEITGLCINMLAATAPDWLPSMLTVEAIGGGFTSRVFFVVEEHKGRVIADPNEIEVDEELRGKLLEDLERIKLLTGDFKFDEEALEMYKKWYVASEGYMKKGVFPVPDPKFAGYCSRRATHIKKIAMIMSASRGDDLTIHVEDFQRARVVMEAAEKKMPRAFSGLGRARFSDLTDGVLSYIMSRKTCLRSELLQRFYRDVDAYTLDQIQRVLEQMKVIRVITMATEGDARYEFIGSDRQNLTPSMEEQSQSPDEAGIAPSQTPESS